MENSQNLTLNISDFDRVVQVSKKCQLSKSDIFLTEFFVDFMETSKFNKTVKIWQKCQNVIKTSKIDKFIKTWWKKCENYDKIP